MNDTFQETRPTCVTVIGWAWIVIGFLMCLSTVLALLAMSMDEALHTQVQVPSQSDFISYLLFLAQFALGASAIFSGRNFLGLKAWARTVLELMTWSLLAYILVFHTYFLATWQGHTSELSTADFDMMFLILILAITLTYVTPLGIMLKYLRGERVRSAMVGSS